ncbi:MAG: cytochrome-c oxidase, cbb3-type subunit III [Burkholderiales bacterium]|nr:cytochrome-c oxidase, cbb3-type subunit III [Burkholderiales bacterium]
MSDFFNSGWAVYVAVATVLSLAACLALLIIASRRKVMASDNTTGHVWDEDLRELNNPLPRWWMWLFVITVVFAAVYLALYPGLGVVGGSLKWTSTGQYDHEQARAREAMAPVYAKYAAMSAEDLARDADAMGIGQRLFINNCAQCHGSDARGSRGFPNLTDADWQWGGDHETIKTTITEGRMGVMPPMAEAIGGGDNVRNVAHYVLSLSDSPHNPVFAQLGREAFAACAACHGEDGKGMQALGAPNLTDRIWLHGWGEQAIATRISQGVNNAMPAQARLLTPEQIHVLAAYVWQLSRPTAVAAN